MFAGSSCTPEKFPRIGVLRKRCFQFGFRQREKLFQKNDGRLCIAAGACALASQLVANFARANNDPLGIADFWILNHGLKLSIGKFAQRAATSSPGCRSMPLGVKTTSGLRHRRSACRRNMWKYCAAVEGWQIADCREP